jgi:hypothetical protein
MNQIKTRQRHWLLPGTEGSSLQSLKGGQINVQKIFDRRDGA